MQDNLERTGIKILGYAMCKLERFGSGFSKVLMDKFNGIACLADVDTYELIYINKFFRNLLNISESSYLTKKCYEVLQGQSSPCDFCINHMLKKDAVYQWNTHNYVLNRQFESQASIVEWHGRRFRLEYGMDFSEYQNNMTELENKVSAEQLLVKCAGTLCKHDDIDLAINKILENVVDFFEADRSYLFEYNKETNVLKGSCFFVRPFVKAFKDILSEASGVLLQEWLNMFTEESVVYHKDVDVDFAGMPELAEAFKERNIREMLLMPIYDGGELIGLIGVDNPRYNVSASQILGTIAMFIVNNLEQRKLIQHLDYLSNIDDLTGVYNRNKYIAVHEDIKRRGDCAGVIYIDLNGLKKINDVYGHDKGDEFIINSANFIQRYFGKNVYRIGGDEFLVLLRNISKEAFEEQFVTFKNDLEKNKDKYDMSYGERYCDDGKIDECVQLADEMMFNRKRQYYEVHAKWR